MSFTHACGIFGFAFVDGLALCESNGMIWHGVEDGRVYSLGPGWTVQVHMPIYVNSFSFVTG